MKNTGRLGAVLAAAGFLAMLESNASADFCPPAVREGSPEYVYISAVVDALGWVKEAYKRAASIGSSKTPADALVTLGRAKMAYECAAAQVAPFRSSKHLTLGNPVVAESASSLAKAFGEWAEISDNVRDEFMERLDGKEPSPRAVADRELRGVQLWDATKAAVMLAVLAIPTKTPDKNMGGSVLTRDQAKELESSLRQTFGEKIAGGTKDPRNQQDNLDFMAASIYDVVWGQHRPFANP
jgi:hypothetical protein